MAILIIVLTNNQIVNTTVVSNNDLSQINYKKESKKIFNKDQDAMHMSYNRQIYLSQILYIKILLSFLEISFVLSFGICEILLY